MVSPPPRPISQSSVPGCENVSRGRNVEAVKAGLEAVLQPAAHTVDADAQRVHGNAQLLREGLAVTNIAFALVVLEHQIPLLRLEGGEALAQAIEPAVARLLFGHRRKRRGKQE